MLPRMKTMRRLLCDPRAVRSLAGDCRPSFFSLMPSLSHHAVLAVLQLTRRRARYRSAAALHRFIAAQAVLRPQGDAPHAALLRADLRVERVVDGPHPVLRVRPAGDREPQRQLLYLPGGAYINPVVRQHWQLVAQLAQQADAAVTVPLYPLAPRHSHRDALPFVRAQYQRLLDAHGPQALTLAGDSAGGGLALALAQQLRDVGLPQPARLLLISPWVDLHLPEGDAELQALAVRDPMLDLPGLREAARLWADGEPLDAPSLSPLHGRLDGLAEMAVFIGTRDLLWPGVRRLRDKAEAAGAALHYVEAPGMLHAWPLLPVAEARMARRQMLDFIGAPPGGA